jgi:opacity protein-like surface antigen
VNRLKTLGFACIAALALTAVLAASAAAAAQFRAEAYPVAFKGQQGEFGGELAYGLGGVQLNCWPHTFTGSASAALSSLSLTPSYGSECEAAGIGATVKANGCRFVLHSTNESAPYTGVMDIACQKEGEAIEVTFSTCQVAIPPRPASAPSATRTPAKAAPGRSSPPSTSAA